MEIKVGELARQLKPYMVDLIQGYQLGAEAAGVETHSRQHNVVNPSDHIIVGSALDLVGAITTDTIGLVVPSSNPGASSKVLKSNVSGYLQLTGLGINVAPTATYPLNVSGTAAVTKLAVNASITANEQASFYLSGTKGAGANFNLIYGALYPVNTAGDTGAWTAGNYLLSANLAVATLPASGNYVGQATVVQVDVGTGVNAGSTTRFIGQQIRAYTTFTGDGTISRLRGLYIDLWGVSSPATVSEARAIDVTVPFVSGGGVVSAAIGVAIGADATWPNTITTSTGLFINNVYATTAANAHAIRTYAGNVVFNEGSDNDTDFRVESATNANALFVDGSLDRVGVLTSSPQATLHVGGNLTVNGTPAYSERLYVWDETYTPAGYFNRMAFITRYYPSADSTGSKEFIKFSHSLVSGTPYNITGTYTAILYEALLYGNVGNSVASFTNFNAGLTHSNVTVTGTVINYDAYTQQTGSGAVGSMIGIRSIVFIHDNATVAPTETYAGYFANNSAVNVPVTVTNAYGVWISFSEYDQSTYVNAYGLVIDLNMVGSGLNIALQTNDGNVIFNGDGNIDSDFRVAGDTNTHLIFADAGLDFVGINKSVPAAKLHVAGAIPQFRVGYDDSNYVNWSVSSNGDLAFSTGTGAGGGAITLAPVGNINLDPVTNFVLPVTGYDINLGMLTKKYLTLHAAELWVETLVAQQTIATIGGRILVGPTNILTSDLAAGATTMYLKYNSFVDEDIVYMEANGQVEFIKIDSAPSGVGPYSYTVVRDLDGTGSNSWTAGDAVFNTGQPGNGFIDIYSVRGIRAGTEIGPTIVGNVRYNTGYNDWAPRWAIGNLNGLYGYSGNVYGTAFGWYATSKTWISMDDTAGFRINYGGSGGYVTIGQWDMSGVVTIGATGSGEYMTLDSTNGMHVWAGGSDIFHLNPAGPSVRLGASGSWNWVITTSGADLYDPSTVSQLNIASGSITVGASGTGEYITISTTTGVNIFGGGNSVIALTAAGNARFGREVANYGNAYWNASNQRLEFRGGAGGTTVRAYIETTGAFVAGGGNISLDDTGLTILATTAYGSSRAVRWSYSSADIAAVWARYDSGAAANEIVVEAFSISARPSYAKSIAKSPAGQPAEVHLYAESGTSYSASIIVKQISTTNGEIILDAGARNGDRIYGMQGEFVVSRSASGVSNLYISGGLMVGTTGTVPPDDDLIVVGGVSVGDASYNPAADTLHIRGDGSGAGLFIGASSDVQLYRNAASQIRTPDTLVVDGDVYTVDLTDYSASSTFTGWSSRTSTVLRYKKVGGLVFVWFYVDGTSNATSTSFTLPYSNASGATALNVCQIRDNGTYAYGYMTLGNGSSTVSLYTTPAGGAWTASGAKTIAGMLVYEA